MRSNSIALVALVLVAGIALLWLVVGGGIASEAAGPASIAPASPHGRTILEEREEPGEAANADRQAAGSTEEAGTPEAASAGGPDALLIGRVLDEGERPVARARVYASTGFAWLKVPLDMEEVVQSYDAGQRAWTETDDEGRFALDEPLRPGPLRLAIRAAGFAPRRLEEATLGDNPPQDMGDIVLTPGIGLTGTIVDRAGRGIAGVRILSAIERGRGGMQITIPGRGVLLGESGEGGDFALSGLTPGPWALILDSPEHQVSEVRGEALAAGEVRQDLLFVLEDGETIEGQVVDLSPERGARARVEARIADSELAREDLDLHRRVRCGEVTDDGAFRVAGLTPGVAHRLTLWEPDGPADRERWRRSRDVEAVEAWPGSKGVRLECRPRVALEVHVVDATSGEAVEEYVLWAGVEDARGRKRLRALEDEEGQALRHHPGGRARFEGIAVREEGGRAALRVRATGYHDLERSGIPIARGQTVQLGELALEPAPVLRVTVRGAESGEPVPGARVVVAAEDETQVLDWLLAADEVDLWTQQERRFGITDEEGVAVLPTLPRERAVVAAAAEGFVASSPEPVPNLLAGDATLDISLASGGTVVVTVRDTEGRACSGVEVRYESSDGPGGAFRLGNLGYANSLSYVPGGGGSQVVTGEEGTATVGPLEPGSWKFLLTRPIPGAEESLSSRTVEVVEGGQHELTLTAPLLGTLSGFVTEGRLPLAGADLVLLPAQGGRQGRYGGVWGMSREFRALSGHDGRYRIEEVPCGEYNLMVTHPERYMAILFQVTIATGTTAFDVELPLTVIEGRVTDPEGRPREGVSIEVTSAAGQGGGWGVGGMQLVENDQGEMRPDWSGWRRRISTDRDGRYRVRGLPSGVELTVRSSGAYTTAGEISGLVLAPDEIVTDADLVVEAAGRLRVRLAGNLNGRYRAVAKLVRGEESITRQTGFWGTRPRVLDGMHVGRWTVTLRQDGQVIVEREVEVLAEQDVEVVLEVP